MIASETDAMDQVSIEFVLTPSIAHSTPISVTGASEAGRVPRIARLMALAIRFEQLLRDGTVISYADLARLGRVSRARITQIMHLINLAADLQETILLLPPISHGFDPCTAKEVCSIATESDWAAQRQLWRALQSRRRPDPPMN